jgi:hypothetical protein
MGLKFEKIHACKNDCILFCGENALLTECPNFGTSSYKWRTDKGDDGECGDPHDMYLHINAR